MSERDTYRWAAGLYGLMGLALALLAGATSPTVPPMAWVGNTMALVTFGIALYCLLVSRRQQR